MSHLSRKFSYSASQRKMSSTSHIMEIDFKNF